MKSIRFLLALLLVAVGASASAADNAWSQGYAQGNYEFFADANGLRLYIACPTSEGAHSSVSLLDSKTNKDLGDFKISLPRMQVDGPLKIDSNVEENNYFALLEQLRQNDATVTYQGKKVVFPKKGADKAIFAGPKATVCKTF